MENQEVGGRGYLLEVMSRRSLSLNPTPIILLLSAVPKGRANADKAKGKSLSGPHTKGMFAES